MRETKECKRGWKLLTVVSSLVLVLMLGLLVEPFSIVSNAQSQGKVTAGSAKIRKEASTSSEALGSAVQGDSLTINHQVTGSDNMIWYQVFVDADTLGYIRSDLVEITDGTTPPTSTAPTSNTTTNNETTSNNTTTTNTNENMAEVTAVEPMSASVTGSQSVRVRSNASTGSQIVTMAQNGLALTVTGQANGTDGKVWYQVNFLSDGSEVTGFIRSDYVALSGELVPVTSETDTPPAEETTQESVTPAEPVVETKDWDTQRIDGKWYLIDNVTPETYDIEGIFNTVETNQKVLEQAQDKTKSQRIWIVILVFLAVAMAAAIAYLVYKMKDMSDSAYFAEVERETVRRRTADRPANSDRRLMHTVGAEKRTTQGGTRVAGASAQGVQRPSGARPAGAPAQGAQRPAGARPAGAPAQGAQRPAGARPAGASAQGTQRPAGARPAGASAQGTQRPAGARPAGAPAQGAQRPAGARPAGVPVQSGTRVAESAAQGQMATEARTLQNQAVVEAKTVAPVRDGAEQVSRQTVAPGPQSSNNEQNPGWKSKNFMADEDEFEFEFLNWDGEDE